MGDFLKWFSKFTQHDFNKGYVEAKQFCEVVGHIHNLSYWASENGFDEETGTFRGWEVHFDYERLSSYLGLLLVQEE
jgi:hypothetical protein